MKIISKHKDYYDYVAGMYGGGDPLLRYDRTKDFDALDIEQRIHRLPVLWKMFPLYSFKWLVVCGKYHLLVGDKRDSISTPYRWSVLSKDKHEVLIEKLLASNWYGEGREITYYISNKEVPYLNLLSKQIGTPVFTLEHCGIGGVQYVYNRIKYTPNIPNLGELGYASVVDATTMYQNIAYYLANTINSVDEPQEIDNHHKIIQHGFDLRQSFRHRK